MAAADRLRGIVVCGLLWAGLAVMLLPFYWMVVSSLKEPAAIFRIPLEWWPNPPRWSNYAETLGQVPFARYFLNSIIVGGTTTLSTVFLSSLAGYGFAKFDFRGRHLLFFAILSTMMIPFQVIMVPLYLIVRQFGWLNSYAGLIVPGLMTAFGVFMMRQYIVTLPDELFNAARIDGDSEFGIFLHVVLPQIKPAMAALAIFQFMDSWNNLLWPLIVVTRDELRTVALGLTQFQTVYGTSYHLLMAACVLASLPVLALFAALQRRFVEGIAMTGLKG